jgi:hypothetical protein
MRANPLQGPLEGVGPENRDFLCLEMAMSETSDIWVQKSRDFQGPPLPVAFLKRQ